MLELILDAASTKTCAHSLQLMLFTKSQNNMCSFTATHAFHRTKSQCDICSFTANLKVMLFTVSTEQSVNTIFATWKSCFSRWVENKVLIWDFCQVWPWSHCDHATWFIMLHGAHYNYFTYHRRLSNMINVYLLNHH